MARGDRIFLPLLLVALAAAYAPGLRAPAAYDDDVWKFLDLRQALGRFVDPIHPFPGVQLPTYAYRPLTELSVVLNRALEPSVEGLRAGNLLIHALAAILVFFLARRLGAALGCPEPAFARWAALFFAVHPLGVQAVTYVYQRAASLEAALAFLTVALYLARSRAAFLAGLLAMTAKETAVTLPLVLAALEWILRDPVEPASKALKRWLPFALMPTLVLIQVLRLRHLPASAPGTPTESGFRSDPGALGYLLAQLGIVVHYLRLNALPFPLHFCYPRTPEVMPLRTALCGAFLLALLGWVLLGRRRHLLRLGVALFLAPLALESSVFPIKDLAFQHRCYPGLLGSALLFAWAANRSRCRALGALALAMMLGLTAGENLAWCEPGGLIRRDIRHDWRGMRNWATYGFLRLDRGRAASAEVLFRHALRSRWKSSKILAGLSESLRLQGKVGEARENLEDALRLFPGDPLLIRFALRLAMVEGDNARIQELTGRAESLPMQGPDLALLVAYLRAGQGRVVEAERILRRQLPQYPAHPELWANLGLVCMAQGRLVEAEEAYRKALSLAPDLPGARRGMEMIRATLAGRPRPGRGPGG